MLNGIIYVFGQNGTGLGFYEVAQQKIKLNGVLQLMHELQFKKLLRSAAKVDHLAGGQES